MCVPLPWESFQIPFTEMPDISHGLWASSFHMLINPICSATVWLLVVFGWKAFKTQSTKKVFATTLFHSSLIKMVHPNRSDFKILNWKRSQDIVNRAYEEEPRDKGSNLLFPVYQLRGLRQDTEGQERNWPYNHLSEPANFNCVWDGKTISSKSLRVFSFSLHLKSCRIRVWIQAPNSKK